jgi:hypothetical protein
MACDCSCGEDCNEVEQGILNVQGIISGIIGSLRTDVGFGKRTQANADEIIDYLTTIDAKLEEI